MKSSIILYLIVILGVALLIGAGLLWHLSSTTTFTRVGSEPAPAAAVPNE